MHYSPRNKGPEPDLGFPLLCSPPGPGPPLPPLLSPSRGPPRRPGRWRPLGLAPSVGSAHGPAPDAGHNRNAGGKLALVRSHIPKIGGQAPVTLRYSDH
jgi:hypothetical protein